MTVPSTTSRADYTGNGSTTAFSVPFYFLDNTHLQVIRTQISTGVATTLALTTDYTLTGAGVPAGGTLTMVSAPTTDQRISILRNVPRTQLVHYVPNDPFPAATHEQALDQLTMEVQQLAETQSRALTLSANSTGVSATLPSPVANSLLGWDNTGTSLVDVPVASIGTTIVANTWLVDKFNGTGAQTAFTLTANPGNTNAVLCSVSGVVQVPGVNFSVSGTTLTFLTGAPPSGTNNVVVQYGQTVSTVGTADLTNTTGTLAASKVDGLANRNVIINGCFRINQRAYVSGAVLASGTYGHDRWKAGASGGDYTFTQLKSCTTITIAAGKSLIQVVEDANINATRYLLTWTGTATARVGVNSATPSGAYGSGPIAITGQTPGQPLSVEFGPGTLSSVQLEACSGNVATPFEFRQITTELTLCQRYFQWVPLNFSFIATAGGQGLGTTAPFKVEMRAAPVMSVAYNDTDSVQVSSNAASAGFSNPSRIGAYFIVTSTAAGGVQVSGYKYSATAEL